MTGTHECPEAQKFREHGITRSEGGKVNSVRSGPELDLFDMPGLVVGTPAWGKGSLGPVGGLVWGSERALPGTLAGSITIPSIPHKGLVVKHFAK